MKVGTLQPATSAAFALGSQIDEPALVGILASLLPGLRELRTPLAVGALWLAAAAIWLFPSRHEILNNSGAAEIANLASQLPSTLRVAGAAFGAYLLGLVLHVFAKAAGARITRRNWAGTFLKLAMKMPSRHVKATVFRLGLAMRPTSDETHDLLIGALRARLDQHLPGASGVVPAGALWEQEDLAQFRLSKEAPEQFGIYDRTRSEAEFRAAIGPPTVAVSAAVTSLTGWWWLIICVLICIVTLLAQSLVLAQRAKQLLITSLALGYTSTPLLDELEEVLAAGPDETTKARDLVRLFLSEPGVGYLHYLLDAAWQLERYRPAIWHMRDELPAQLREKIEATAEIDSPPR